jgi:hypothetical protein
VACELLDGDSISGHPDEPCLNIVGEVFVNQRRPAIEQIRPIGLLLPCQYVTHAGTGPGIVPPSAYSPGMSRVVVVPSAPGPPEAISSDSIRAALREFSDPAGRPQRVNQAPVVRSGRSTPPLSGSSSPVAAEMNTSATALPSG